MEPGHYYETEQMTPKLIHKQKAVEVIRAYRERE